MKITRTYVMNMSEYASLAEWFDGSRLLIYRGEIPITGSNPVGRAI